MTLEEQTLSSGTPLLQSFRRPHDQEMKPRADQCLSGTPRPTGEGAQSLRVQSHTEWAPETNNSIWIFFLSLYRP